MSPERWASAAGDLLLGASCHGCGVPAWGICPQCRATVAGYQPYPTAPDPTPAGFPVTVTSAPYDAVLRNLVNAHKERQALVLTRFLAERLAVSVHRLLAGHRTGTVTLVPVPSGRAAVRERGFDATWAMTRLAARRLHGIDPVTARRALDQRRGVADQAGLSAGQRAANLRHGFQLRRTRCVRSGRPGRRRRDHRREPDRSGPGAAGGRRRSARGGHRGGDRTPSAAQPGPAGVRTEKTVRMSWPV